MGKKKTWKNIKRAFPLYIMVAPGFLYLLINNYVPMTGIIIAFKHLNFAKGILHSDWAGLSNFKYLFKTPDAALITRNTLLYNFAFIVVNTTVSILIAILLSELRSKTKVKIFQSAVLIPSLISIIIVSYLVYAFLSGRTGFVNGLLTSLGKENISFYTESKYWPFILIFVNCWKGAGYSSIIYLAAILGIDQEMYEAAEIDGATRWHKIKCITLPLLKSTVITMTLLSIGRIFYSDFGLFYQATGGIPASLYNVASTFDTYIYKAIQSSAPIGKTAAASFFQSVCCCATILLTNWLVKKVDEDSAII